MRKTRGRGSGRGGGGTRDTKLSVDNNISNNEPSPPKGRRSKRQQEIGGRANVDLKASRKSASTARRASTKRNGSIASVQRKKPLRPWDVSDDDNEEVSSSIGQESSITNEVSDEEDSLDDNRESSLSIEDEIFFPWIELDESQIEPLVLPSSSSDLLIDGDHLFDALEVYEVLRRFYKTLQLSPFHFEDFCSALRSSSQSNLLCEIHIALIRLLFRDDEEEQTTFVPPDTAASFNALIQALEPLTFSEVLFQYTESDKNFSPQVLEILQKSDYPFVEPEKRLIVLKWLCERLFETAIFKRIMKFGEIIEHDKVCRFCGKAGDLLNCSSCEAAYHLSCIGLKRFPDEDWFCTVCNSHRAVAGSSTDSNMPIRQSPIGYDRHGRIYWYLARRIFAQDSTKNEVYYYTTLPQLYDLVSDLDPRYYEASLCTSLMKLMPSIAVQMHETLELTDRRREVLQERTKSEFPQPYIHVDNAHRMSRIISHLKNCIDDSMFENDDEVDEYGNWTAHGIVKQVRTLLCIEGDSLVAPFWAGNLNENQLLEYYHLVEASSMVTNDVGDMLHRDESSFYKDYLAREQQGFRLGFSDSEYRQYVNHFTSNELSKSFAIRAKEKDKKKNLNTRFGLLDDTEFSPFAKPQDFVGTNVDLLNCLQLSLVKLIEEIPAELMHRLWIEGNKKQKFLHRLNAVSNLDDIKKMLLLFERIIRKPVFSIVWWNCLGHTKLLRATAEERERRQRLEQLKKKDDRIESQEETDMVWVKYSLIGCPPKHNIWKMKDEQYRVNGVGSLGGWMWVSSTLKRVIKPLPNKAPLNIRFGMARHLITTLEAKKSYRLERLIKRFTLWRIIEENSRIKNEKKYICYSSSCQFVCSGTVLSIRAACPDGDFIMPCYSPSCIRNNWESFARKTREKVTCRNVLRSKEIDATKKKKEIPGEDIPFPFPKPHKFTSVSGKQSLLILPRNILRKLARQGGINAEFYFPGFSKIAKANTSMWLYPCPRPLFDQCWRYMTNKATSLHAVAFRFKQLYLSIRWADMAPDEDDDDPRVWTHLPDLDEVRVVIGHKEHPPDGYYEQYKIKVEQYLLDEGGDDVDEGGDDSVSYGSGVSKVKRKRKAKKGGANQHRKIVVKERWIDGVDLMLYEMVEYWKQYFQQKRSAKILARPPAQKQQQHNFPVQQQQQRQFHQAPQIPSYSIQQNPNPLPVQRYNSPRVLPVSSSSSTTYGGTHQPPPFKTVAAGYAAPMVQVQNQPYQQQQQNHPHGQLHVRAPTAGNPTTIVTLPHGMRLEPGTTFKFVYEQTYQQNTFQ